LQEVEEGVRMIVRYDREKLERTIQFLLYDFRNGSARMKIDEEGNLHFYRENLKLITIQNLTAIESEIIEKNGSNMHAISSM
jgi:hypothetical protein